MCIFKKKNNMCCTRLFATDKKPPPCNINDNEERLIGLCEQNDLIIGGTLFPHSLIRKFIIK